MKKFDFSSFPALYCWPSKSISTLWYSCL